MRRFLVSTIMVIACFILQSTVFKALEFGGIVPYTAYNARISYIDNNKETIEAFTRAVQKGLDFVNNS